MLDEKFSNFVFYLCTTKANVASLRRPYMHMEWRDTNEWTIVWRKKLTVSDIQNRSNNKWMEEN